MTASDDASSLDGLSSANYNFVGVWSGPLTFTDLETGGSMACTSEIKISQPPVTFTIEYGNFNCGGQVETWPRTVLSIVRDRLYIGSTEVGRITTEKVSFTYVTLETILQIEVFPLTLSTIKLKVTYLNSANSQAYARLVGTLTRQ